MASGNSSGTVVRLVILLVVLVVAAGGFFYVQNRKPGLDAIQQEISAGTLWGEPLQTAKDLFKVEPRQVANETTDSPSAQRWLFKVNGSPPSYYLIFVQDNKITNAQLADENGIVLPK
jgi:hypothetical protein